jgi:ATP-dependent exoDNAse (exonuclease V) alpha subunit
VALEPDEHRHLDYGYAVTSHSSQGQTADRVVVHVEMERAGEKLVNRRFVYVALSRGRHDAQLYTDDKGKQAHMLDRDVSHRSALERDNSSPSSSARSIENQVAISGSVGHTMAVGPS